jgi:hypothetical protein
MISHGRTIGLLAAIGMAASGCGGHGASTGANSAGALSSKTVAAANANCRFLLRAARTLGKGVLSGNVNQIRQRIDTMVVKPSIPLLEQVADRQQALEREANSAPYATYADLFDPIIVLTQERLAAGQAGNHSLATLIEKLAANLEVVQERTAQRLGLHDCEPDFQRILINSLSG